MIARLLLCLAVLLAATPAHAIVCTIYDQPLDQEQVDRYAAEVKDGYPAKYRATLDAVKITLSDAPDHNLVLVAGRKGSELVVPAGYLKTNCLLAMGAALYDDYAQELRAKGKELDFELPECPEDLPKRDCLLQELDKSLRRDSDPERSKLVAGPFRMMIESAFKYAIGHEFGHVIADAAGDAVPRPADYDAELEADMLALHTIAAGQVMPLADSFLFGGQVLMDAAENSSVGTDSPHESTICRARRSNAMRDRLIPPLMEVRTWTLSGTSIGEAMPRMVKEFSASFIYAPIKAECPLRLPAEVAAIERDLKRLSAAVSPLPPSTQLTEAQLAAIERLELRSPIGRSLRDAIYGTVSVVRIAKLGGVLTNESVDAAERKRLLGELARVDSLPSLLDMASRDYRDFLYIRAVGRFASAPPGARFSQQAAALRQELDRANTYGQPHMVMNLLYAVSQFLAGDCNRGMATLLQVQALRETVLARAQLALDTYVIKVDDLPAEFVGMIAFGRSLQAENKEISPEACRQMREAMAQRMRATYDWVD